MSREGLPAPEPERSPRPSPRPERRRPPLRPRPLIVGALIALACLSGFWELAEDFARSPVVRAFDVSVTATIISWRTPQLTAFMRAVTLTGGTLVVSVVTVALVAYLWRRRHAFAVSALVAIAGGSIAVNLLKNRFDRIRPLASNALIALPGSYSFPSGHSMASLCVAGVASYVVGRSAMRPAAKYASIAALVAWVLAVGISRVYLGVHWPSDVIASWLLGAGWLALLIGYAEARREVPLATEPG